MTNRKNWWLRYWKLASGTAHLAIAGFALLASAHVIPPSGKTLAILIAWAQTCTAIHYGHSHWGGDT